MECLQVLYDVQVQVENEENIAKRRTLGTVTDEEILVTAVLGRHGDPRRRQWPLCMGHIAPG